MSVRGSALLNQLVKYHRKHGLVASWVAHTLRSGAMFFEIPDTLNRPEGYSGIPKWEPIEMGAVHLVEPEHGEVSFVLMPRLHGDTGRSHRLRFRCPVCRNWYSVARIAQHCKTHQ